MVSLSRGGMRLGVLHQSLRCKTCSRQLSVKKKYAVAHEFDIQSHRVLKLSLSLAVSEASKENARAAARREPNQTLRLQRSGL